MFEIPVKDVGVATTLGRIAKGLKDATPLARAIAGTLETETERNFAAEGRPAWLGLAPATAKRRTKAGTWPGKILQVSGKLAASVATDYGRDYARIGSNRRYAAIQQLGGTIARAAFSSWGALRTDRQGNLLRQGAEGRNKNLAVFAKASHKRVKKIRYTVGAHSITIPARPFLPADAGGNLQPEARAAVLSDANAYLRTLAGP